MSAERDELMDLVAAVSDGEPVDWESRSSRARDGKERSVVRSLHVVAKVAQAHRELGTNDRPEGKEIADLDSTTAPATSFSQPRPTRWGHLEIVEKVGEGGFGEVFRARDPRLDREVALKLRHATRSLRRGSDAATLEEGRLLARIRHPNVATVHGAEEHDSRVGIWMEFIRGMTLARLLRDQGPFGAREAGLIGIELCRALTAVHRAGIVHRDVKAQNVMREEGGRIVLMDFGAGKELAREDEEGASGTPLYMAPEILEGAAATVRSDVYSVGVLLAHLVTAAFPVEARSIAELRERHRKGETRLLRELRPDLPEAFVQVVESALAPDPADRFQSTGRMERALAEAMGAGRPGEGDLSGWAVPSIRRWIYVAAGIALLALLVASIAPRWPGVYDRPLTSRPAIAPASGVAAQGGGSLGADPRARVASLHDLAGLYEAMGAYERAAEIYGQALAVEEQALGQDDPLLGDSLTRLAWLHHVNGNEPEARVFYERATLVLDRQVAAPDAGADAALLDLGVLLGETDRRDDATKFLESVLEHRERTLGPNHPQVAAALDALAKLYVDAGDYASAKPLLESSAAIGGGHASKTSSFTSLESLGQRPAGAGLYDVEATLYRSGGPRGKERLGTDSRVVPDDKLFLELRSSIPLYVYVVNEDDRGEASLLFPLPGFDLVNPLPPDAVHRLPGRVLARNQRVSWQVSSAGGREHFLVVASPERLVEFEDEIENLIIPQLDEPLVAAQLSEATTTRLRGIHRGIAQLAVEPEDESAAWAQQGDTPVRLFQLARPLGAGPETVRGVWIRQIDLGNPG